MTTASVPSPTVCGMREVDPEARAVIDAEGLGSALWALVHPDDPEHWQLCRGRGLERQALVDELLVAVEEDRFRFAPPSPSRKR